jgi:proteasome beta subunit
MSRAGALRVSIQALTDAADEDRATGGVDVERGIYPVISFCSQEGVDEAVDTDIDEVYRDIMARRRSGSGEVS